MLLGPVVDAPLDEWERMLDLNVKGLLYVPRRAAPPAAGRRDGPRRVADLVNISSVAGRVARIGSGVYNLTKHGVGAFSESLRQEVTGRHVRVPGRAGRGRHRAGEPQPPRGEGDDGQAVRRNGAARVGRHRRAIGFIVTRPRRVAVNEMLVRPTEQEG